MYMVRGYGLGTCTWYVGTAWVRIYGTWGAYIWYMGAYTWYVGTAWVRIYGTWGACIWYMGTYTWYVGMYIYGTCACPDPVIRTQTTFSRSMAARKKSDLPEPSKRQHPDSHKASSFCNHVKDCLAYLLSSLSIFFSLFTSVCLTLRVNLFFIIST